MNDSQGNHPRAWPYPLETASLGKQGNSSGAWLALPGTRAIRQKAGAPLFKLISLDPTAHDCGQDLRGLAGKQCPGPVIYGRPGLVSPDPGGESLVLFLAKSCQSPSRGASRAPLFCCAGVKLTPDRLAQHRSRTWAPGACPALSSCVFTRKELEDKVALREVRATGRREACLSRLALALCDLTRHPPRSSR